MFKLMDRKLGVAATDDILSFIYAVVTLTAMIGLVFTMVHHL